MMFKNGLNRIVSYFETDEENELEESSDTALPDSLRVKEGPTIPEVRQELPPKREQPVKMETQRQRPAERPQTVAATARQLPSHEQTSSYRTRESQPSSYPNQGSDNYLTQKEMITIAIKYPKKYEDATEIVDLLASQECVLIDFQYMLDAQARRCLDFIDGASHVLGGTLQKVGSSMYLLTPNNVVVEAEDITLSSNTQDYNFDYDMKRR